MEFVLLAARVIVAVVFVIAGVAKLADRAGTRRGIAGFGVPEPLVNPTAIILPLAELAAAAALIPGPSAWWGACGAVILLAIFIAGIAINLAGGNTPDCHCFGQIHSEPIGASTLIRNGFLTALAALIVAQGPSHPGRGPLDWLGGLTGIERAGTVIGAIIIATLLVVVWLLLDNRRLLRRIEAAEAAASTAHDETRAITLEAQVPKRATPQTAVGDPAPEVGFIDMYGRAQTLADYRGWDTIVLFWDSNAPDCKQILPVLRGLEARPPRAVPHLLIVVPASASANQTIDLRSPVVIDRDGSVARVFGAESAPTAIMVDARGAVASELAAGANQVAALVTGSMPHVRARVRWAGLDLEVSREAPPPPPEFETVAEKAVELARERDARIVAAVGAGSGAIPILLARELPEARIYTTDISAEALAVAHRNVERHGMTGRVELLLGELLAPVPERPDLIVATFPEPSGDAGGDGSESDARLLEQMTERGWSVPVVNHLGSVAAEADQDQAQPAPAPARRRAFGTWPTISLLRRNAGLRARLASLAAPAREQPGLPVGSPAPNFRVRGLDGNRVTLDALRSGGRAVLLLFVSPTCGPCIGLMPDIARWQDEYAPALSLALISSGSAQANREKAKEYGASRILLQRSFEVGDAYAVTGTPSAVLVHPDGTIASPLAGGPDMIRALLDQYIEVLAENAGFALEDEGELDRAARAAAAPLEIGAAAPNLELVDLAGNIVRPADFRGRDTVLLFWGLSCGFCREMLPDVREWERRRPQGAPDLLVVLASEPQPGQRLPFESPVVIDRESAAASALHSGGTPTAILIDRQGRIGSQPVVGAVPILDLLGSAAPVSDRASA